MKRFSNLAISLLLLTACSTQVPQPTPTSADSTAVDICHRPFRDAIDWDDMVWPPPETESTSEEWWEATLATIIPQAIEAGEVFLDNCMDFDSPLLEQTELLDNMAELATMIYPPYLLSPDWQEQNLYQAKVQLVNLDNDYSRELILAARALNPRGNFYAVYNLEESTQTWHGTLVWPGGDGDYSLFRPITREPWIRPLSIANSEKQSYVLITGRFYGGDHSAELVWVWRWEGGHLEAALKIELSDWCGPEWRNWEVTEEGILIHATVSTSRCEGREAVLYYLEDGEFTSRTQ